MTRDEVKTAFSTHTSGTWLQCLKQPHPSIQFGYLMACVLNKVILHCQRVVVPKASILKHEIKAADLLRIDLTFAYSYAYTTHRIGQDLRRKYPSLKDGKAKCQKDHF